MIDYVGGLIVEKFVHNVLNLIESTEMRYQLKMHKNEVKYRTPFASDQMSSESINWQIFVCKEEETIGTVRRNNIGRFKTLAFCKRFNAGEKHPSAECI